MVRETPTTLRAAAGLVALQGLVLAGLGVFLIVRGFNSDATNPARAELGGVFALAGGALFVALARGQLNRRRWARSPTLVLELLCLPVGYGLLQNGRTAYGVPLIAAAVGAIVLLGAAGAFAPHTD